MTAHTSMLNIRIDDDTKAKATVALNAMGLSMTEAVRLFLHRVVAEQAFPLELRVPNARTRAAMAEADEMLRLRQTRFTNADELFADLEKTADSKRATLPRVATCAKPNATCSASSAHPARRGRNTGECLYPSPAARRCQGLFSYTVYIFQTPRGTRRLNQACTLAAALRYNCGAPCPR